MASIDKPLVWLHGEVKTPPFSAAARLEVGVLLRRLQWGERVSLPQSRPLPRLGPRSHERRIQDAEAAWRLVYRVEADAIVIAAVFSKKTQATPRSVLEVCQRRLRAYDKAAREEE